MSRGSRNFLITAIAFAAGGGALWLTQKYWPRTAEETVETFTPPVQSRVPAGDMTLSTALSEEFARAVERVMPGVVSIQVQRRVMRPEKVVKGGKVENVLHEKLEPGIGSGAIISKEGHIVTNWHVVEGGTDAIFVTLSGETNARHATLLDKDDQTDIALLRVEVRHKGEQFTGLRFGDSDKVKRGHLVLALGSPFNLRETVTNGIISHRERRVSDTLTAYLQTTCIINPGNSGGPLVNLEGDIIGLVTRKLLGPDENAASEGYGLAIPGNDVLETVDRLRNKNRPRIYLGLSVDDYPVGAWQRGQPSEAVIIFGIWKGSPAEKAGLHTGDIIESVDGTRVTSGAEYKRATLGRSVGDTLTFAYRRDGAAAQASVKLEDFEKAFPPESTASPENKSGVWIRPLNRHEQNRLSLFDRVGLFVESVEDKSPFAGILRPHMIILGVSDPDPKTSTPVATPADFEAALQAVAATGGYLVISNGRGPTGDRLEFGPLPNE